MKWDKAKQSGFDLAHMHEPLKVRAIKILQK